MRAIIYLRVEVPCFRSLSQLVISVLDLWNQGRISPLF